MRNQEELGLTTTINGNSTESEIAEFYVGDKALFFFGLSDTPTTSAGNTLGTMGSGTKPDGDMIAFGGNAYNYIDSNPTTSSARSACSEPGFPRRAPMESSI